MQLLVALTYNIHDPMANNQQWYGAINNDKALYYLDNTAQTIDVPCGDFGLQSLT